MADFLLKWNANDANEANLRESDIRENPSQLAPGPRGPCHPCAIHWLNFSNR